MVLITRYISISLGRSSSSEFDNTRANSYVPGLVWNSVEVSNSSFFENAFLCFHDYSIGLKISSIQKLSKY